MKNHHLIFLLEKRLRLLLESEFQWRNPLNLKKMLNHKAQTRLGLINLEDLANQARNLINQKKLLILRIGFLELIHKVIHIRSTSYINMLKGKQEDTLLLLSKTSLRTWLCSTRMRLPLWSKEKLKNLKRQC